LRVWSMGAFPIKDGNGQWVARDRRKIPERRRCFGTEADQPTSAAPVRRGSCYRWIALLATLVVVAVLWAIANQGVFASVADVLSIGR